TPGSDSRRRGRRVTAVTTMVRASTSQKTVTHCSARESHAPVQSAGARPAHRENTITSRYGRGTPKVQVGNHQICPLRNRRTPKWRLDAEQRKPTQAGGRKKNARERAPHAPPP